MSLQSVPRPRPIWIEPEPLPDDFDWKSLHPHRLVASLLWRRGIRTARDADAFLNAVPATQLDPSVLPNIDAAVERVARALRSGEHIGIFGDYDTDGATSAAIIYRALTSVTDPDLVTTFIPDRTDGYGVSARGVNALADAGATLLIAVDCGTNDHPAVELARARGTDVVILDHHSIHEHRPDLAIVVNPQLDAQGRFTELTGAGVAWLFALALLHEGFSVDRQDGSIEGLLDLAALGTVVDVGALRGANRSIVRDGMPILRRTKRPGLRAMFRHGDFQPTKLTTDRLSFGLGPRLNAAGRVGSADLALRLLLAGNDDDANAAARQLEQWNASRKSTTDAILREIAQRLMGINDVSTLTMIAMYGAEWDTGLVGPIASKVVERMGVPAIIMQERDGVLSGSGRSVHGVDLLALLREADHLMTRYGGHAGAAGMTIDAANFEEFQRLMHAAIARQGLALPQMPEIRIHAWLPEQAFSLGIVEQIAALEPFGHGNDEPVFGARNARLLNYRTMGKTMSHLKMSVGSPSNGLDAVMWSGSHRVRELQWTKSVDLVGTLSINTFRGEQKLQMIVKDFEVPQANQS